MVKEDRKKSRKNRTTEQQNNRTTEKVKFLKVRDIQRYEAGIGQMSGLRGERCGRDFGQQGGRLRNRCLPCRTAGEV
jgi:hypothetical protein